MNQIAIIMVNINNYEYYREFNDLKDKNNVDWYYFTDTNIKSTFWKIININEIDILKNYDNRLKCKYIKMMTHVLLPQYKYFFWIDGSFPVKNINFIKNLNELILNNPELILYIHNARSKERNIENEVKRCSKLKCINKNLLYQQYNKYISEGYPNKKGKLFSSGIFLKVNNLKINMLMELWFEENSKYTTRDQISLPYCIWKLNIKPIIINENINLNKLVGKKEMKSRKNR